jgi:hypothetical protein
VQKFVYMNMFVCLESGGFLCIISRGERLFGLSDIYGDVELYTSNDREKFAVSEYVYNSISP